MKRGCFRVSPLGTDVMRVGVRPNAPVGRCVSSADTSLSLSLSGPSSTPRLAADFPRTDRRLELLSGVGRSLCICGSRRPVQGACSSVAGTASLIAVSSVFEEAPVRTPICAGSVIERRGLNPRPRRSTRGGER